MKNTIRLLARRARPFVGAPLLLFLFSLPVAAQCGDDLYVEAATIYTRYGTAVAVEGDWAAVGLPGLSYSYGAVDMLERIDGEWRIQQRLVSPNVSSGSFYYPGAWFGYSLSMDGTTLAVGAFNDASSGPSGQGSAIIFELQAGQWIETARLEASDGDASDQFGVSIALDGDYVVVGAHSDEAVGGLAAGSAYIFERNGSAWTEVAKIQPSGIGSSWRFGGSVDIDGSYVVVGAKYAYSSGSAFVFQQYGSQWIQQAELTDPAPLTSTLYGHDVAMYGDVVAVGHPGAYASTGQGSGLVHLWQRSGTLWNHTTTIESADGISYDNFGGSIDFLDDKGIVVGAFGDDLMNTDSGAVYVFEESGGVWTETAQLGQCQPDDFALAGSCVDTDGTTILAGAPDDNSMTTKAGKALIIEDVGGSWSVTEDLWSAAVLSLAAGGVARIEMDFGAGNAGRMFFVVGSTSGTTPGFNVLGQHIPLNYDFYTIQTAYAPNAPPLTNSFGFTDGSGLATCVFTIPPATDPILAGLTVTHCAVLVLPLDYVTNTDDILLYD